MDTQACQRRLAPSTPHPPPWLETPTHPRQPKKMRRGFEETLREADLHYDREGSEDTLDPTTIDQAAPPSILQWPPLEADHNNGEDMKNRSDNVVPDPSRLPRPLAPGHDNSGKPGAANTYLPPATSSF